MGCSAQRNKGGARRAEDIRGAECRILLPTNNLVMSFGILNRTNPDAAFEEALRHPHAAVQLGADSP